MAVRSKINRTETLGDVRQHEVITNLYIVDGCCTRCAAQLAYGHQLGFGALEHRPCDKCTVVVAGFPVARQSGWRTVAGSADHRASHRGYSRPEAA